MHFRWNYFLIPINGKDAKPSRSCSKMLEAQWHPIRMINPVDKKNITNNHLLDVFWNLVNDVSKATCPSNWWSINSIWFFGIIGLLCSQKVLPVVSIFGGRPSDPTTTVFSHIGRGLAMPIRSSLKRGGLQLVIEVSRQVVFGLMFFTRRLQESHHKISQRGFIVFQKEWFRWFKLVAGSANLHVIILKCLSGLGIIDVDFNKGEKNTSGHVWSQFPFHSPREANDVVIRAGPD